MKDDDIRKRLLALKDELQALSKNSATGRAAVELDQTAVGRLSRMDALQQQAMDKAIESRRQNDMQKIDAALQRLKDGEYGYCLRCGEAIATARLALDPAATLCTGCAKS